MMWKFVGLMMLGMLVSSSSFADEALDAQAKALAVIENTARNICSDVEHSGSTKDLELSGNAKASLGAAIAKLTDLGIDGAAKYVDSDYKNVLQKDLAVQITKNADCRLDVFHYLAGKMLTSR